MNIFLNQYTLKINKLYISILLRLSILINDKLLFYVFIWYFYLNNINTNIN